jgi:diadenylate cyclase
VVRGNRVTAATCYLPLSERTDIGKEMGTRHRAGFGISEATDALTIIISEETGAISYALGGQIHHDISPVELRQALEKYEC